MTHAATIHDIALDVKSLLVALSDHEIRFNTKLMTRTAKLLRMISNVDLADTESSADKSE